jgi:hypothetical protein
VLEKHRRLSDQTVASHEERLLLEQQGRRVQDGQAYWKWLTDISAEIFFCEGGSRIFLAVERTDERYVNAFGKGQEDILPTWFSYQVMTWQR